MYPHFLGAIAQGRFKLRVAAKTLAHPAHFRIDLTPRLVIVPTPKRLAFGSEFVPTLDEAVGPHIRVGLQDAFPVHTGDELADTLAAGELRHGLRRLRIVLQGRTDERMRSGPNLIQVGRSGAIGLLLRIENGELLADLPIDAVAHQKYKLDPTLIKLAGPLAS